MRPIKKIFCWVWAGWELWGFLSWLGGTAVISVPIVAMVEAIQELHLLWQIFFVLGIALLLLAAGIFINRNTSLNRWFWQKIRHKKVVEFEEVEVTVIEVPPELTDKVFPPKRESKLPKIQLEGKKMKRRIPKGKDDEL